MNFNVNFVVRPAKMNKAGYSPLEVSIIIGKDRSVLTLPRKIRPKQWNQSFQMVEAEDDEAKEINEFINASRLKLFACQSKLMSRNIPVTIETVKDAFSGKIKDKNTSLVTLYQEHNEEYKAMYKADSKKT